MKNKTLEVGNLESLVDRYFEGITSLEEEKTLRDFFQQKEIPESLKVYRSIFGYFNEEIGKKQVAEQSQSLTAKNSKIVLLRWIGLSVAASLLLFVGIKTFVHTSGPYHSQIQSLVYIDGVKYTDMKVIESEMLKSLDKLSETNDEAIASQIDMLEDF